MDDKSFTIRVPKRWARVAMIVGVAALIVAPLTAVASHVFNDVPDSHTFHNNITWLADADVTKGCNPPDNTEFCPDDNVTRGQMAAFMQRFAQYIDAEDGTPGQADTASGVTPGAVGSVGIADESITPSDMAPDAKIRVWADTRETANVDGSTLDEVEVNSVDIHPPADGFLIISGTVVVNNNAATLGTFSTGARLDGANLPDLDGDQGNREIPAEGGADDVSISYTVTVPVTAGTHTVTQVIDGGTTDWNYRDPLLTVQFIPGPLGSMTASSSATADTEGPEGDDE